MPGLAGKPDLIVSNPPYVARAEFDRLSPEVRRAEPRLALVAGPTGFEFFERFFRPSFQWLNPGGILVVEVAQGELLPSHSKYEGPV